MLSPYAYSFVAVMNMLRDGADQLEADGDPKQVAPVLIEKGGKSTMVEVGMQNAMSLANELGMFSTLQQVIRLHTSMLTGTPLPEFIIDVRQLIIRIEEDLRRVNCLFVANELVPYWNEKIVFGDAVAAKFKAAAADIESAGKCLAVGQGTACVFHLMRAMEVAVRTLGKRLKMTITPQTTWRQMTGNMDFKIKAMPESNDKEKRKKNDWEAARTNLHHVGSVWRNNTMHPAKSYTPSQAKHVFNAVRVFMSDLCAL